MLRTVALRLFLLGTILFLPAGLFAQGETTSAIDGQVNDASGSAVPGAMVTIRNTETGLQRVATTDDSGRFNFTQLKPGTYTVRVEAQGFEPRQNDAVTSGLGQKQTVDFLLKIAQARENIEVSSGSCDSKSGECEYIDDSQRTRAGRSSQSGRRYDLSPSVCRGRADQYGREQQ